ncbi:MAG: lipopolysaccharide transport periplasmic protein LptA [Pseudomonadota bacterium]|nr:lipopolysaccharide transport periplasmic protein LptA [Pseudomonadota bacterium]
MPALTLPPSLRRLLAAALMPVLLAAPTLAAALEEDQEQPVYLEADSVELDELKAISIYTGNVFIQQGSMQIRADQVTVHHYPDRRPERIIAVGAPAKYRQQLEDDEREVEAEALRMEYEAGKDEITLIDQAVLLQGEDRFSSDRIVYDRANGRVSAGTKAQGKERVKITINPSQR